LSAESPVRLVLRGHIAVTAAAYLIPPKDTRP
jgi:hypothetical protein